MAIIGKIHLTSAEFRKVIERLLNHLTLFDVVNARRGAAISHNAITANTTTKKNSLIYIPFSIENMLLSYHYNQGFTIQD
jgi:hypothetical protein